MGASPNSVGPIRNQDAVRICTLANIAVTEEKLTTLRQLRNGLDMAIADLDRQKRKEQLANNGLLVLRFAKATCESFVELAGEMAEVVLPKAAGEAAKGVAKTSKLVGSVAEAASTKAAGGEVGVEEITKIGKAAGGLGDTSTKLIIKSAAVKAEVIHDAMNQDHKGVLKKAASYVYELHAELGKLAGLKKTAAFAKIAKQAFEYNEHLGKAFDAALKANEETLLRHQSLKANLTMQARRLSKQIEQMEAFVQTCTPEPEMRLP
jgi:hypothetical protein